MLKHTSTKPLEEAGISYLYHYTPLHYIVYIARSQSLMGKPSLTHSGFPVTHFRSMSWRPDVARGFGDYLFLTLDRKARILSAKLNKGFPHIGLELPIGVLNGKQFHLCRFNIAMTRYLRRDGKPGYPEMPSNGKYVHKHQIPVATAPDDQRALLKAYNPARSMIEIPVVGDIELPPATKIICFNNDDVALVSRVLSDTNAGWIVELRSSPGPYSANLAYRKSVSDYIQTALGNKAWKGNGLEFDRV